MNDLNLKIVQPIVDLLKAYFNDESNSYITNPYDFEKQRKPYRGAHIRVNRSGNLYYHHGIYESSQKVYQFRGEGLDKLKARIECTTLEEFLVGGVLEVRLLSPYQKSQAFSTEKTIQLAKSCVGEEGYNLLSNNCEHFANLCVFGIKKSQQVEKVNNYVNQIIRYMTGTTTPFPTNIYDFAKILASLKLHSSTNDTSFTARVHTGDILASLKSHTGTNPILSLEKFYRD